VLEGLQLSIDGEALGNGVCADGANSESEGEGREELHGGATVRGCPAGYVAFHVHTYISGLNGSIVGSLS
jgi:hypothetical protein